MWARVGSRHNHRRRALQPHPQRHHSIVFLAFYRVASMLSASRSAASRRLSGVARQAVAGELPKSVTLRAMCQGGICCTSSPSPETLQQHVPHRRHSRALRGRPNLFWDGVQRVREGPRGVRDTRTGLRHPSDYAGRRGLRRLHSLLRTADMVSGVCFPTESIFLKGGREDPPKAAYEGQGTGRGRGVRERHQQRELMLCQTHVY